MALIPGLNWLSAGAGALVTGLVAYGLHSADVALIDRQHAAAMAAQEFSLNEACLKDKAVTKEANDDLQKQRDAIADKLADAERVHPSACVVLTTAGRTKPAASRQQHAGQNGVDTSTLREYAAECETYRSQRITLEQFINQERHVQP